MYAPDYMQSSASHVDDRASKERTSTAVAAGAVMDSRSTRPTARASLADRTRSPANAKSDGVEIGLQELRGHRVEREHNGRVKVDQCCIRRGIKLRNVRSRSERAGSGKE